MIFGGSIAGLMLAFWGAYELLTFFYLKPEKSKKLLVDSDDLEHHVGTRKIKEHSVKVG
jgi:hypothetical protein